MVVVIDVEVVVLLSVTTGVEVRTPRNAAMVKTFCNLDLLLVVLATVVTTDLVLELTFDILVCALNAVGYESEIDENA